MESYLSNFKKYIKPGYVSKKIFYSRGKFGEVIRCTDRDGGQNFAAKFVKYRKRDDRENVEREVEIMNLLDHPKLLFLYYAYDNTVNEMCLVTE